MSLNRVVLCGRLVADPDLKTTNGGVSVANLRIAVERNYKDSEGNKTSDFFNCVAWRGTADFVTKFFHKGELIIIDGKLQNNQYTDKDGNNRTATQINVDSVFFCGGKGSGNGGTGVGGHSEQQSYGSDFDPPKMQTGQFADLGSDEEDTLPF